MKNRLCVYLKYSEFGVYHDYLHCMRSLQFVLEVDRESSEEEVEIGQLSSSDPSEQSLAPLHLSLTKVVQSPLLHSNPNWQPIQYDCDIMVTPVLLLYLLQYAPYIMHTYDMHARRFGS